MHWILLVLAVLVVVAGGVVAWFETATGTWIILIGIFLALVARFVQAREYARRSRGAEDLLIDILEEIRDIADAISVVGRGASMARGDADDQPVEDLQPVRRSPLRALMRKVMR